MARHGDGLYRRGPTWWFKFIHQGRRYHSAFAQARRVGEWFELDAATCDGIGHFGPRP